MPRFAANVSLLFGEVDFLARFAAARDNGFRAVECLFPYAHPAVDLASQRSAAGLEVALFNSYPGDWQQGERGIAALPGREAEFRASFAVTLQYARALSCSNIHVLSGLAAGNGADQRRCYVANLRWAADHAARDGINVLVEALNAKDMPNYLVASVDAALAIIHEADRPNVRLQLDLYHVGMMGGRLAETLRAVIGLTRHIQIAGVPGRHEPDVTQEIDYPQLFALIDELGYRGWVGCEYRPRGATAAGLGWGTPWGLGQPGR